MENATKALLMAAGILIAIIVLTLGIAVYGRISRFYQTKQSNLSQEQLAAFNSEYTAYDRDDVSGFELVSLINKCIDFNQNKVYGANNTSESDLTEKGEGYQAITVSVEMNNNDYTGLLFSKAIYTYDGKNSGNRKKLAESISEMQNLERRVSPSDLTNLTSYATEIAEISNPTEVKKKVKEITGKDYNITSDDISKYSDYLTFKRGTFKCEKMTQNSYGQICEIKFKQTK